MNHSSNGQRGDEETSALSRAIQSRDRRRVEKLLNEHREYLCRVVSVRKDPRLNPRVDVSDIVQEAQLEAVRRLDEYLQDPVLPVKLWLRKLACDRLIMEQRRHLAAEKRSIGREYRPDRSSVEIAKLLVSRIESPSRQASERETTHRMQEVLDELREKDREIIVLHLFEGLNSHESALVLDIEPSAARKRFGRALARLRERLAERDMGASSI